MFLDRRCIAPHIGTKRRCVPIMTKNGDYEINFKINLKAHLLQFPLRVLVRMVMGSAGEAGQGFNGAVPSISPEVDVGPTLVVFAAGLADAVFCCVFQKGLPEPHVLCYTV